MIARLFYDVGSPYAYLAVERAEAVFGRMPRLHPVLLGGLFKANGRSSWARTERRAAGMAEVEERARRYGLPPVVWPKGWPSDYLFAMRMCVHAGDDFARAAMRAAFAEGVDLSDPVNVVAIAGKRAAGHDDPSVKARLRELTDEAHALGVFGVPTVQVGDELFWGDDRLEAAAGSLAAQ
jgi:2-hydroxychromene-2-carboxylate isomerase